MRGIGPQFSPIQPKLYPWIFITCDIVSLILQAVGGGTAASADTEKTTDAGGHIMLAGIVFQVATFTALYILALLFVRNIRANRHAMTPSQVAVLHDKNFKVFAWGIFVASVAVYIRCIYRIAELAGGWKNKIMQDEVSFYVLDGAMVAVAVVCLTVAYPGAWYRPVLRKTEGVQGKKLGSESEESGVAGSNI